MRHLRLTPFLALLAATAPLPAQTAAIPGFSVEAPGFGAEAAAEKAHVSAKLTADRSVIAPGESFLLALTLKHPAHWHTYWKNPGDAGSLTSVTWKDNPGATFGEWRYPAPHLYDQGGILNYVFEGEAVILIPVKAPATLKPGDKFTLTGRADWLECDDKSCHPQGADLAIEIPVAEAGTHADAAFFAKAEAAIPENLPVSAATLTKSGKDDLVLTLAASALAGRDAASARFFPVATEFSSALPQAKPVVKPDGSLQFTFPEATKLEALGKLEGVVTFGKGGRAFAVSPGLTKTGAITATGTTTPSGADSASGPDSGHGLPMLLLLAFGGGMLLNIMPCVFPVLGLKIYGFVNKAHADRKKVVAHALAFAAGIVVSFWILAAAIIALKSGAVSLLGASGQDIGWGFLLQIPGFVAGIAVLFLVMGLSLAGLFEFGTGVQSAAGSVEDKGGYAGSFLSGVLATLVATPCSGPGIAPALGAAFAAPPLTAFLIFTAMALGLALPFVALAASPKLMALLPRPGAWMESFKQAMAFLLFGTLAYFVWILGAQTEGLGFLVVLFALVGIAIACWVFGRWAAPHRSDRARLTAKVVAGLFFIGSCFAIAKALPEREVAGAVKKAEIVWQEWTPESQAKHLAAGETVYVDFTARWCATCQVNKRVFHEDAVIRAFADKKVVALKADWTNRNALIGAELSKYNRAAIPFNVVLKSGAEAKPLPEVLTADAVLEALK